MKSLWMHAETVCLVDCLNKAKRLGDWTPEARRELQKQVQEELETSGFSPKTLGDIYQRIQHVGKTWTTTDKSGSLALYYYGWGALREECTRSVLLSDPTARSIPKAVIRSSKTSKKRSRCKREDKVRRRTLTIARVLGMSSESLKAVLTQSPPPLVSYLQKREKGRRAQVLHPCLPNNFQYQDHPIHPSVKLGLIPLYHKPC